MTTSTQPFANTTGTVSWTNPNNALTNDADYAVSASVAQNTISTPWRGFNPFGSNPLPSSATIDGIEISITGKNGVSGTGFFAYQCTLRKGGTQYTGSSNTGSANFVGTTDQTKTIPSTNGSTFLWGLSGVTGADLNDSTFGVHIQMRNGNTTTQTFSLKYVSITVYYTVAGVSGSQQQFFMYEF